MKLIILGLILFIEKQVPVETKELWRDDGKCGEKNKLPSGKPGECNPKETGLMNGPCCSEYGFCGNTESHCDCPKCVNYSQEEKDGDGSLPAKFLGTYKRTKQTGLDDLMYALGIDWFKRKVADGLTPTHTISQNNGVIKIFSDYFYRKHTQEFKLGKHFEETTPDGRSVKTTISFEGDKLMKKLEPLSEDDVGTVEAWEFLDNGDTLEVTTKVTKDPKTKSVETYEKEK